VVREEPKGWCLGDWATPEKIKLSPELVNTCYYYHVTDLMTRIAAVLGKVQDEKAFRVLASAIKNNINRKFYRASDACYLDGKQGANLFPLAFGITPEKEEQRVFASIVRLLALQKNHFDTGILATPLLLKVLTDHGRADLAYEVMNQKDFPGFGHYILGKNATTLWENWNGASSHSHPMYGSVVAWFFNTLAGISPAAKGSGWQNFEINPCIDNELTYAKASYQSVNGRISSSWVKTNGHLMLEVEIPANTTATIHFPGTKPDQVFVNDRSIMQQSEFIFQGTENGKTVFIVGSGKYLFETILP
jgi:alpha-L-rhamnosidase